MTRITKLYDRLRNERRRLTFAEFCALLEAFHFTHRRTIGSHRVYVRDDIDEQLNIQPRGKDAKPYQAKQFLAMIDAHALTLDRDA